jgi:hypothetical protein
MMGSKWRRKLPVAVSVPLSITNHETERPLTGNLLGFNEPDNLDSWPTAAPFPGHKGPTRPRVPRATLPNSSSSRQLPAYLIRPLLFVVPFLGLHLLTMYPPYNNSQPHYPENGYQQPPQPPPQQPPASNSHPARDRDPPHPSAHRLIGTPLDFSTGQFAGKHVRAELIELQKADLGRKYVPIIPPLSLSLSHFVKHPFIPLFLKGTLARIADPSIHPRSFNSNFSTRIPALRDPMRKWRITSCASPSLLLLP